MLHSEETTRLISAEAANAKFPGWGSSYRFYAGLLAQGEGREMEARDAAVVCFRMPIWTVGQDVGDFGKVGKGVGVVGKNKEDDDSNVMANIDGFYERLKQKEKEELTHDNNDGKTERDGTLERASYLLDKTAMVGQDWAGVREELASLYDEAGGLDDLARFIRRE